MMAQRNKPHPGIPARGHLYEGRYFGPRASASSGSRTRRVHGRGMVVATKPTEGSILTLTLRAFVRMHCSRADSKLTRPRRGAPHSLVPGSETAQSDQDQEEGRPRRGLWTTSPLIPSEAGRRERRGFQREAEEWERRDSGIRPCWRPPAATRSTSRRRTIEDLLRRGIPQERRARSPEQRNALVPNQVVARPPRRQSRLQRREFRWPFPDVPRDSRRPSVR